MPEQFTSPRRSTALTGEWRFQLDQDNLGEKEGWFQLVYPHHEWGVVAVPGAWNYYEPALWTYEGAAWYMTVISAGMAQSGACQKLIFQRVSFQARVWLNGRWLGEHYGGDLPFECDVSGLLDPRRDNILVLRVDNTTRPELPPGSEVIERVIYGGILKPVVLETTHPIYIAAVKVAAEPAGSQARVSGILELCNSTAEPFRGSVGWITSIEPAPENLPVEIAAHAAFHLPFEFTIEHAEPWSPEHPRLYPLWPGLYDSDHRLVDAVQESFGVRKIAVQGQQILLNGQPLFIKGVNRYDEFAGVGPVASRDQMLQDLRAIKQTGANFIRVHYPQDPDLLDLLDEIGLMVMEEVFINWWGAAFFSHPEAGEEITDSLLPAALQMLEDLIQRDGNHPCVIAWSMANESATDKPYGSQVMRMMMARARQLDPTRLVTFVIAGDARGHTAAEAADFVAVNIYPGVFDPVPAYHISEFAVTVTTKAAEVLSQQVNYYRDKPVVVTEFGCHAIRGLSGDVRFSEDYQARYIQAMWQAITHVQGVQGGVLWCWADYYHRRGFLNTGFNAEYGPFGVVTIDRQPKKSYQALSGMFGGST